MNVRRDAGFTLMELLLVVAIIGILAAMLLPNISGRSEEARKTRAKSEIVSTLGLALTMFESDTGSYPTTEQGLEALVASPDSASAKWRGPYIRQARQFRDPWGNKYQYQYPGENNANGYDLTSGGPDGQTGTEDDISNYDEDDE
jgi:general secretion pathway protein G